MSDIKVNAKVLVALAFFAAAINSSTVAMLCALAVIFVCKEKALATSAIDAVLLSITYSLVYAVLNYANTLADIIAIGMIESIVGSVVSLAISLVRLGVIAISLIAAFAVLDGREPKIPLLHNIHKDIDKIIAE